MAGERPNYPDMGKPKQEGSSKDFVLRPDGSLVEAGDITQDDLDAEREK